MQQSITFAADDFGLTRNITDTILETVDKGPVTLVSVIPNGEAVAYALEEYKKRAPHLTLAVHLNLTEGKALSAPQNIPHLVDSRGMFKHSVMGLWLSYIFSSRARRAALRHEVRIEMEAQYSMVRSALSAESFIVNSHQHIHLIPFVFDELLSLLGITRIRTVREPFQWSRSLIPMLARSVLALLSSRAARIAHLQSIATNDSFIGFVHSGHMTEKIFRTGLARAKGSVEALFHPGSAAVGELSSWQRSRSNIKWHYSPWRAKEREALVALLAK